MPDWVRALGPLVPSPGYGPAVSSGIRPIVPPAPAARRRWRRPGPAGGGASRRPSSRSRRTRSGCPTSGCRRRGRRRRHRRPGGRGPCGGRWRGACVFSFMSSASVSNPQSFLGVILATPWSLMRVGWARPSSPSFAPSAAVARRSSVVVVGRVVVVVGPCRRGRSAGSSWSSAASSWSSGRVVGGRRPRRRCVVGRVVESLAGRVVVVGRPRPGPGRTVRTEGRWPWGRDSRGRRRRRRGGRRLRRGRRRSSVVGGFVVDGASWSSSSPPRGQR